MWYQERHGLCFLIDTLIPQIRISPFHISPASFEFLILAPSHFLQILHIFLIVWILFSEQRIHFGLPLCKSAVLPLHLSINSFTLYPGLKTSTFSSPSFLSLRAFYPLAKENQGQGRTSFSEAATRNNSLPSTISIDREHCNIQQYKDSIIQL